MRFTFIQSHARIYHIATMCRVLEVSRAGYYAWRARPLCERVKDDWVLYQRIRQIQEEVKGRYGRPRMHQELKALGFRVSPKRVGRVMREGELQAKRPRFCALSNAKLAAAGFAMPSWQHAVVQYLRS